MSEKILPVLIAILAVVLVYGFTQHVLSKPAEEYVLQADPGPHDHWPDDNAGRAKMMEDAQRVVTKRVRGMTERQVTVHTKGDDKLVIRARGLKDPDHLVAAATSTANLELYYLKDVQTQNDPNAKWKMEAPMETGAPYVFTGPRGEQIDSLRNPEKVLTDVVCISKNKPILTGKDLMPGAKVGTSDGDRIVINIEFNKEGTRVFREFTRAHVDDILAVFFDSKLLTAPKINEPIPSGRAVISGFRSLEEAKETVEYLNAGALPVRLRLAPQGKT